MLFIYFNLKHGIGEGLKNLSLYFDFILLWHSILSLVMTTGVMIPNDKMAAVDTAAANYEL